MRRRWLVVAAVATGSCVVLAALVGRMVVGAKREMQAAQHALATDDHRAARRHLRRTMAHYLPFSPWVEQAEQALLGLARAEEAAGRDQDALETWHTLRGAILSLRGAHQPRDAQLRRCNERIAALTRRDPRASATLRTPQGSTALLARLGQPEEPGRVWTLVALSGFLCFVLGTLALLLCGLDRRLRPQGRRFWVLGTVAATGLALFFTGLAWA